MIRPALLAALALAAAPVQAGLIRDRIYLPDAAIPATPFAGEAPSPVTFATADGLRLSGFFWPGTSGRLILFFHGNGGNQGVAAHYVEPLAHKGDAVLVASYRGYGGNPGRPSEKGLMADARAALAVAHAQGYADDNIYLFGFSLGAGVALQLAAETRIAGVITLGAFTRLADAAPSGTGWLLPDKFDNLAVIARIGAPILMLHSVDDEVIPYPLGTRLYAAARDPKLFATLRGTPHRADMTELAPILLRATAAMAAGDLASLTKPAP